MHKFLAKKPYKKILQENKTQNENKESILIKKRKCLTEQSIVFYSY